MFSRITRTLRGSAAVFALFMIAQAGCHEIPNQSDHPSLRLVVNVPNSSAAKTAVQAAAAVTDAAAPMMGAQGVIQPPPAQEAVHVMLTLTNPDETYYIYNYQPGAEVSIMVTSGVARLITAEAYRIPAGPTPTDFNALHYVTITPPEQRTVDLKGDPVNLTLDTALDTDLGQITAGPPYPLLLDDGSTLEVPVSPTCPDAADFWVNVNDNRFGLTFPSINVNLYGNGPLPLVLNGLPKGRRYSIQVFQRSTQISGAAQVLMSSTVEPVSLSFSNYARPVVTLLPEKPLTMLIPGDLVHVGIQADRGLGGYAPGRVGPSDTCAGVISGGTYQFTVPGQASCVIDVSVADCGGISGDTTQTVTVNTTPPPACSDGIDNDRDGLIDYPADPGCSAPDDNDEHGTNQCDDGIDNDGWGDVDMNDPGCTDPSDTSEYGTTECDDGIDNDGWGDIDVNDPGCTSPLDTSEYGTTQCDDGIDNDGWGDIDVQDPACLAPTDNTEFLGTVCDDGIDNDGDGLVDAADSGCASPYGNQEFKVWFVDAAGAGPTGDSWAAAFPVLQSAVDAASYGDKVLVKQGTYLRPVGATEPVVTMKNGVALNGGCAGTELMPSDRATPPPVLSILDGEQMSDHVVAGASNSILDGFAVQNGNAADTGGGMYLNGVSNATVANCSFSNNSAYNYGGGMYISGGSGIQVMDSSFTGNQTTITGYWPPGSGAGIYVQSTSPTISDCVFTGNVASADAPAIMNQSANSIIKNCLFTGNSAGFAGGAIENISSSPQISNCTIAANYALRYGQAMENNNNSMPILTNCIIWNNTGASPTIDNQSGAAPVISYSDVQGGYAGTGNINTDPLFTPQFRLSQTASGDAVDSPCLDAGSDTAANLGMDTYTTRQDGAADSGQADMGYHYPLGTTEPIVWLVSPSGNNASGLTWSDAFTDPQTAVNAAGAGQNVLVAQGTYTGPGGDTLVTMKNNVSIYGGFLGTESDLGMRGNPFDYPTVFDGANLYSHVVRGASNALLDGVAVTRGLCAGCRGAGVLVSGMSNFTLSQCNVYGNNTNGNFNATGLFLENSNNSLVVDSWFHNNTSAGGDSGAGALQWAGTAVFSNCLFYQNDSGNYFGGGLGAFFTYAANTTVQNCTFAGNLASSGGESIDAQYSTVTVIDSILWGTAGSQISLYGGGLVNATYTDVSGGLAGTGNLNADPLFATGPRGAYYLTAGTSPCINAGSSSAASLGLDIFTTDISGLLDSATVDQGYHYAP